jgi:starch synthase (maltosyl-transferring)
MSAAPSRVIVLAVRPEVDGGRYPVKRVAGDVVEIEADVVADGHDVVRVALLHKPPGEQEWREIEMSHGGNDAWRASFPAVALGRHRYTVEAWIDRVATWRHGYDKKLAAGVDVTLEAREGELLAAEVKTAPDRARCVRYARELELHVERPLAAASAWYEVFPRSFGNLRESERVLDYVAELGFDIVYLPPIHPIGNAFRKGPDNAPTAGPGDPGSPWAVGNREGGHTSVHPELGTLDDFDRFVAAARARQLDVAIDIAFQCSPDHPWVREHPTWFKQRPDGTIQYAENPPKKYQDVYPFDFESADWRALWNALRDVFTFWCEHGVRVFRVDNPHTKPIAFWEWCLGEVSARYPDAVFLAEAFTRPKLMYALAKSGFSQSYTYFTWRTSKPDLETYLRELVRAPVADFFRPCFWPTTPDIFPEHLAHGGRAAFVQRLVLAATLSASYGIYGPSYELMEREMRAGVEELARNEKYQRRTWDLGREDSLRHVVARVNRCRRALPALADLRSLRFHRTDNELVLAYSKRRGDSIALVIVNLDPHHTHRAWLDLDLDALGLPHDSTYQVHDLLSDGRFSWRGARNFVELVPDEMPAHVFEIKRFVRSENNFEYFL